MEDSIANSSSSITSNCIEFYNSIVFLLCIVVGWSGRYLRLCNSRKTPDPGEITALCDLNEVSASSFVYGDQCATCINGLLFVYWLKFIYATGLSLLRNPYVVRLSNYFYDCCYCLICLFKSTSWVLKYYSSIELRSLGNGIKSIKVSLFFLLVPYEKCRGLRCPYNWGNTKDGPFAADYRRSILLLNSWFNNSIFG